MSYWRMLTTFFYFGDLNISTLFHIGASLRFGYMLEESHYGRARRGEFIWLILLSAATLLCLSSLLTMPYLSRPMAQIMTNIWCRKNRHQQVNLWGFISITAPYLPYVYIVIDLVFGSTFSDIRGDLVSLALSHICTFPAYRPLLHDLVAT
ncbi:hypothetical protein MCUN1_000868 [Malassezia cuniculi]|uniref:Derlin n=1 Tax=Malassezia cuniculi TaxID=948313 RepID=A0AAF0ERW1_9BASI|nr:hypothetical protein MCUN1_000868 [Malassezia cuniculi]